MRLIEQPESREAYGAAVVLATPAGAQPATELVKDVRAHIASVELMTLALDDPSSYEQLFRALEPVVDRLGQFPGLDVVLSAGTPQMQTLWIILVKAGLLDARMLQVIPAAFVPSVHPRAVRQVRLDIEGFPEIRALREEIRRLRAQSRIFGVELIGDSAPMRSLAARIARVAPTEVPVLIHGETGTGKELVARAVHESSHRASGPLITENCGALTETVLASELFGHERGAFTGAAHTKRGLFELAHGGTLFLDEVGELSPRVQVNLLRVLQDGTLRRLGSEKTTRVDVRIIAATHRDLAAMVREGSFREDLYYRLRGATLAVPPLRARRDDLEPLITHFLRDAGSDLRITRDAWRALEAYSWPGNVRELRAEVMRWHVFCDRDVRLDDLAPEIHAAPGRSARSEPGGEIEAETGGDRPIRLADVVARAERRAIIAALTDAGGNLSRAARSLDIDRNTLKRKIRKLDISHESLPRGRPPQ